MADSQDALLNYFNYFTEVEEYFIFKRGKNLLVSPLDWCLIELWKENGIPLHVVLRGIDRSFESSAKRQVRTPSTLFYCHPAVLECFQEYSQSQVGAGDCPEEDSERAPANQPAISRPDVERFLSELREKLVAEGHESCRRAARRIDAVAAELRRASGTGSRLDHQRLEKELKGASEQLVKDLRSEIPGEQLRDIESEVRRETRIYRKRLSKEMYERLYANYLSKRILSLFALPEFSLLNLLNSGAADPDCGTDRGPF